MAELLPTTCKRNATKDPTAEDWKQMTLMEKWKVTYEGKYVENSSYVAAQNLSMFYFWFISITELVTFLFYIIPEYFQNFHPLIYYMAYLLALFVFVESCLNWFYTRKRKSYYVQDANATRLKSDSGKNSSSATVNGYSTFKWRYCNHCELDAPPRSHHCKMCGKCILKRDHHCFMTGVCVGFYNQRHFIVLNFYIAIASVCGMIFTSLYIRDYFLAMTSSYWDFLPPVTSYKWWTGSWDFIYMIMMFHMCTLWWTGGVAIMFVTMQFFAIIQGKTTYEAKKLMKVRSTTSFSEKIRSVFGKNWPFVFVIPESEWTPLRGDGTQWDNIKTR